MQEGRQGELIKRDEASGRPTKVERALRDLPSSDQVCNLCYTSGSFRVYVVVKYCS